jgi:hypothetical protein
MSVAIVPLLPPSARGGTLLLWTGATGSATLGLLQSQLILEFLEFLETLEI